MAGTFAGFESYRLNGVQLTEEELGRGSYAVVLRVEYRGLKCAGKQLYPVFYEQGVGDTIRRFEEECQLLAKMRHPNIVQFIGVYFEKGSRVPILVMEFLPGSLAKRIDANGVLPEEISYSILHDVALGLYHLHSQTPPIVHRDLSANNVLLDSNMTAKISDLGVARILNLTPQQMSRMTRAPGTAAYMPPEAMRTFARYDARIDKFSYGILMIHVLCGRWPLPVCKAARPDPQNHNQLIPVSEADRREEYLRDIGSTHPLMDLILRCVSNNPACRAGAAEMVQQMADMVRQFPPSFSDRVEMLHRIETETNEKQELEVERKRLEAKAKEIYTEEAAELNAHSTVAQLREDVQKLEHQEENGRSELAHSVEIKQTRLQIAHSEALQSELKAQNEILRARLKSQSERYKTELGSETEVREHERRALRSELESLEKELTRVRRANRNPQAAVASKEKVLSEDQEIESKQQKVHANQQKASAKRKLIAALHMELSAKRAALVAKNAAVSQKELALEQQASTIRSLNAQLMTARDLLSIPSPQCLPQANITWKPCSDLPVKMSAARTLVIGDKVYCGGGDAANDDANYQVFCYCPSEDTWTTLPALPVRYFGLGQVRGKLVTVGGEKRSDGKVTNKVYEFDDVSQSWKESVPPMPTARHSPAVLSHNCALIVAGGVTSSNRTSIVEIFMEESSQWHTTEPLPFDWSNASSVLINNRWYLLGGAAEKENRAVCARVDQLLQKILPRNRSSPDSSSTNKSAWSFLFDTPHYTSAAAAFGASLLCIGGHDAIPQAAVYVYSHNIKQWIHICDLPAPQVFATTAVLSAIKILVIGGWNNDRQNSVYQGIFSD